MSLPREDPGWGGAVGQGVRRPGAVAWRHRVRIVIASTRSLYHLAETIARFRPVSLALERITAALACYNLSALGLAG